MKEYFGFIIWEENLDHITYVEKHKKDYWRKLACVEGKSHATYHIFPSKQEAEKMRNKLLMIKIAMQGKGV